MNILAYVTGEPLTSAIVWIVVIGLICWLLWWFIDYCGLPQPFNKVAKVAVALLALVLLIRFLVHMFGVPW